MNASVPFNTVLPDVLVPISLLRDPTRFGGVLQDDCLRGDLVIRDGRSVALKPSQSGKSSQGIVLPRLTECHVHLDKCHTISRMRGVGGDLRAAIEAQNRDREGWTEEDLWMRGARGLNELLQAGCGVVRSHVDWTHGPQATEPPLAWHVLQDLAADMKGQIDLQVAALTGVDDLADPVLAEGIAVCIASGRGVLGAFVLDQPDRRAGIENAFRMAEKYGLALDFHVDEGLAEGLGGLETIADLALETGFQGPILCGHACSLMNLAPTDLKRVADKLASADITVATLPTANLFLQGRTEGTPDRRGVTRIAELRAANVPVIVGSDNVRDAFCPLGWHDPRRSLALAALAAHLDPPYGDYLTMITTSAQAALGLAPIDVDGAATENLILFDAASTSDLLAGTTSPRDLADVLQGAQS